MSYYESPRWTNEIADCSMPMTFDTYGNCSFGCLYCFSQFQRSLGLAKKNYLHNIALPVNIEKVKRIFLEPESSQFGEYIKQRKVMQWGGLSDQFDGNERAQGLTLKLLEFFREINYPICFSTKSVWWTKDPRYVELFLGQKNWNVKFSIITLDEQKAALVEKRVPTPKERLEAMEQVANFQCGGVTLRLRPFIIGISTPTYLDLIREAAKRGATALSTEFLCVEERSELFKSHLPLLNQLCGFDLFNFYKKYSTQTGYLRLNRNIKRPFVERMLRTAKENGMRFYVSDAHFKELCDNGSCCGLPADWNYSRGQWCEALQIAKRNGKVTFGEIRRDIDKQFGGFFFDKSIGFNTRSSETRAKFYGMTMADYIRWLWNNPQAGQSPYRLFEGILTPGETDANGNIVYYYNPQKSLISIEGVNYEKGEKRQ